jgi:hypothetical protein
MKDPYQKDRFPFPFGCTGSYATALVFLWVGAGG